MSSKKIFQKLFGHKIIFLLFAHEDLMINQCKQIFIKNIVCELDFLQNTQSMDITIFLVILLIVQQYCQQNFQQYWARSSTAYGNSAVQYRWSVCTSPEIIAVCRTIMKTASQRFLQNKRTSSIVVGLRMQCLATIGLQDAKQWSTLWYIVVRCCTVHCNMISWKTVLFSVAHVSAVQYSNIHWCTVQCSTVQCSAVPFDPQIPRFSD